MRLAGEKLSRLHYELGKTYDLAMVYTWIAALLNVLVLWDAFEGPAYGYGDETPEGDSDASKPGKTATMRTKASPNRNKSPRQAQSAADGTPFFRLRHIRSETYVRPTPPIRRHAIY